ncbi:MAG: DUF2235 domain-containing protein [Sulfuricella sp.]|nr:DUF2235 domain-containing protein [Sulfuricella sp.]
MRNLVICCDGTWNTPDQEENGVPTPTNVVKIRHAVDTSDGSQLCYYHPGVGADGGLFSRVLGGGAGKGLSMNIMSAYRWLCDNHQAGDDRLFLFGFSRGAYTVRSLGGFISKCGILDMHNLDDKDAWARIAVAYQDGYRNKKPDWAGKWNFKVPPAEVKIHFIGVWDTVGALGIPDDMALLNLLDDAKDHNFHDTALGANVSFARHALALDEKREAFTPTLWNPASYQGRDPKCVKQLWFPGVHSDVGGGYPETGLSDGALQWMMDEAAQAGLKFLPGVAAQINPNHHGTLHDSATGAFKMMPTLPRNVPLLDISADIHPSAQRRHSEINLAQGQYRPTRRLLKVGDMTEIDIYAAQPWNETGLYLEKDAEYQLEAGGEWQDSSISCGPNGSDGDGKFQLGEVAQMAGSVIGKLEKMFKSATGNQRADFKFTKREEEMSWFALIGMVANGGNLDDKKVVPHDTFQIGTGITIGGDNGSATLKGSGYLYAFANDAWLFYGNNRGSVRLKVTRTK